MGAQPTACSQGGILFTGVLIFLNQHKFDFILFYFMNFWAIWLQTLHLSLASGHNLNRRFRLAFGSCSRQTKPKPVWEVLSRDTPDLFVWTGDAVYVSSDNDEAAHRQAYREMYHSPEYTKFRTNNKTQIIGVYDDHDFGCNDAGREFYTSARRDLFFEFLDQQPPDRPGAYAVHRFGSIKVILLDTRSFRDDYLVKFLETNSVLSTLFNTFSRTMTGILNLVWTTNYNRDILGENQWDFLEKELQDTQDTRATIIVSSIQMLTSNPIFESWTHFPQARARFFNLIQKYQPPGLLVVSGDVHFSEFLGKKQVVEVTSSGLTHSCAGNLVPLWVCESLMSPAAHRFGQHVYFYKNVGTLDYFDDRMEIKILSATTGETAMAYTRRLGPEADRLFYSQLEASIHAGFLESDLFSRVSFLAKCSVIPLLLLTFVLTTGYRLHQFFIRREQMRQKVL